MKAIGIDIGTTSICGIIIDAESGNVIKSVTKNSNAFINSTNVWEKIQSVDKIISLAMEIINEFISEETAVIGVTGQMHGIVYTDKNGDAVSPLYTWQDERGNLPYNNGTTYAKHLNSSAGYGNVTDFYNRVNGIRPDSAVSYCTIHDYFVMKLCGMKLPVIHTSDAASFGCYDMENNSFTYDFNPEITGEYRIAGEYRGIPVSVAIGDNQASVFSSISDNDILLNVGTGSQISVVSDKIAKGTNIETRPYFDNKYLIVGAALCGGRAYSMLKDFYTETFSYIKDLDEGAVYEIMNKMLQNTQNPTLKADTRFAGTRADNTICGSIDKINTGNFRPGELVHAVLEGMVCELYGMYGEMNVKRNSLVGSGNGVRKNAALVKIAEESFNSAMKIPAHLEEAAVGAALFGLVANGTFETANDAQKLINNI